MKIIVLGAGIIGISTAWHLLERGHEVTVVDRQGDAALETSFANAAQISVSYCEPWANRDAPGKLLKWMFRNDAPLLFRPQLDWQQWRWGLQFLSQCNGTAFERNVQQIVALGSYSHQALKDVVRQTGISYNRLERGIAHYYTEQKAFDAAGDAAALMRKFGVAREVVSRDELLRIEPAFKPFGQRIVGGTFTASDESGDARVFTQALAQRCSARGAEFLYHHDVVRLNRAQNAIESVAVRANAASAGGTFDSQVKTLKADAVVVACGSYSAPLLRSVGVDLPIYPGKGYSATFKLLRPELAPMVSTIDDEVKCAMSRLGDQLRVAGTIELGGFDLSLNTPLAQARCRLLAERIEAVLPGVCDTRSEAEGGQPRFWTGLRPATPTNVPYIGRTKVGKLWVNAGHGTLGWTHGAGSGKAMAALLSGELPAMPFNFYGFERARHAMRPITA
ncbi:D-amino acid dehydrogenase [Variovorax sp. HJSM1_2]|uniref:D-amino acid dehydrogenase n=1 Tax=Variovorax sp. HJSM1_2 TaxID=3366263 RepID=UPI003BED323B